MYNDLAPFQAMAAMGIGCLALLLWEADASLWVHHHVLTKAIPQPQLLPIPVMGRAL